MAFEKFTKNRSRIGKPRASIWTRGQIGLNQGAVAEYDADKYKYAVLYFDKEERRIGIELTNDEDAEGATKIIVRKNAGVSFSATAFLKTYKIDHSKTRQYPIYSDKESGLIVLELE